MNRILKKSKYIFIGIGIFIVGASAGIGIALVLPYVSSVQGVAITSTPIPIRTADIEGEKKKSLAEFYNQIVTANENQDWATLYTLARQSLRDNETEQQFIAYQTSQSTNTKAISQKTIVNSIEIADDTGIVDRTIITCLTNECDGGNRKEENAKKEYEFVNGKWQIPEVTVSERALKAANYAYEDMTKSDQTELIKLFGSGSESPTYAVRNWAISLDNTLEELVRIETLIEKRKTEQSQPVYVQQPDTIIQQQAPVIQQRTYPRNCTSNTYGNSTYTNCY